MKLLDTSKKITTLQTTLTLANVCCLILSNILVVKPIDLFGIPYLANTCAIVVFPITYILSDVFSEVYGYKWSRITATYAFIGTSLASALFMMMIAMKGNAEWGAQAELETILGSTPMITVASVVAFWCGDWVNDKVFQFLKSKDKNNKLFGLRAVASSVAGKMFDSAIFTFVGLSFLPLRQKVIMTLSDPWVQIAIETLLLPVTAFVVKAVTKAEQKAE